MSIRLKGGFATDRGIAREKNEDSIILQAIEQQGGWFAVGAVCDGIGGLEMGEVASKMVITEVIHWFEGVSRQINIAYADANRLFSELTEVVQQWNKKVCEFASANQVKSGTTLSLIMILRNQYFIIHVGDSRIYRYNECMEQLTKDEITEKITNGKSKSFLNNFIGKSEELKYTTARGMIKPGDVYIYCSDGFYHNLTRNDMEYFVNQYKMQNSAYQICVNGIRMMEERQERDNISVGMIVVE